LGICVGEQMLFSRSEEGQQGGTGQGGTDGLDIFPGRVVRFDASSDPARALKIPHMGWNRVHPTRPHALWQGVAAGAYFYFVHSYFVQPADAALQAGYSDYGIRFTCAVARDNIFAVQFHPEKSASAGLQLYRNFARWQP